MESRQAEHGIGCRRLHQVEHGRRRAWGSTTAAGKLPRLDGAKPARPIVRSERTATVDRS
jgi:hypothetical protein